MMNTLEIDRDILAHRIDRVYERVAAAASAAGRSPADITIVAVSKTFPRSAVDAAHAAGLSHFGENRVQEAVEKFAEPLPGDLRLHLIGQLQTNKGRAAVGLFDLIESVDRPSLIAALEREATKQDTIVRVLLQVNVAREPQKSGCDPDDASGLIAQIRAATHLRVDGLMTIAPIVPSPDDARPTFRALRELRDELQRQHTGVELGVLSMGMSGDFEAAIREGTTHIRVGSAIFGSR